MDGSETGSANFYGPAANAACPPQADPWKGSGETGRFPRLQAVASTHMHLRPPSVDKGLQAFLWALFFFLFLWLGMIAVDVSGATAFIFAGILSAAIFLYVRIYGEEEPSRRGPRVRIR